MKVRVQYRALCPYEIKADGTELYHWYTSEYETDNIIVTQNGLLIDVPGTKESHSFMHEQIELMKIVD